MLTLARADGTRWPARGAALSDTTTMQREFPVRAVAACFALAAFCVAIWSGLNSGRSAEAVLGTAIIVMFVCQPLGYALGVAFKFASLEQISSYKNTHPIPAAYDSIRETAGSDESAQAQLIEEDSEGSRTENS